MRAQPVKMIRKIELGSAIIGESTFVEDRFQGEGFVVCESTRHVVRFRVADHETEVCFECKAFFIHSSLELSGHSADIHRVLDDLEITIASISQWEKGKKVITRARTWVHDL